MTLDESFQDAQGRVNKLSKRPDDLTLLELYGLFKQATAGDVTGSRPGMLDFKGRAKWDAWSTRKGMSADKAKEAYVALVNKLAGG